MSGDSIRCKTVTVTVQENGIIRRRGDGYLIGRLTEETEFDSLPADATAPDAGDAAKTDLQLAREHVERDGPQDFVRFAPLPPDAGDAEALALKVRQSVQESGLYDDDAMPYVVGEDASDEQNRRQDDLVQWVIDRAAEAAQCAVEDLADNILREAATREAQLCGAIHRFVSTERDLYQQGRLHEAAGRSTEAGMELLNTGTEYGAAHWALLEIDRDPPSDAAQRVTAVIEAARRLSAGMDDTGYWQVSGPNAVKGLRDALRALDGKAGERDE